jgi:chemotaxis protein MotB
MSDVPVHKKGNEGAPAWVMTFADLMSLLMCFFVLLLSFSEMDVAKYKQLSGSMRDAFGVQREIKAKEPPKGVNVIAREFSPGRPRPTPMNVVRQMTTRDKSMNVDLGRERRRPKATPKEEHDPTRPKTFKMESGEGQSKGLTAPQKEALEKAKQAAVVRLEEKLKAGDPRQVLTRKIKELEAAKQKKKLEDSARLISNALAREIEEGSVDVEIEDKKILIRVREKASFDSGLADLKDAFRPILGRVAKILEDSGGQIIVAGHTDNIPINTERFRSNWELSSARAVSVVHAMMKASSMTADRFLVQGFADTAPLTENDTPVNRARNRRVEIILQQGENDEDSGPLTGDTTTQDAGGEPATAKTEG